jgi:hypothetical protein
MCCTIWKIAASRQLPTHMYDGLCVWSFRPSSPVRLPHLECLFLYDELYMSSLGAKRVLANLHCCIVLHTRHNTASAVDIPQDLLELISSAS